MSTGLSDAATMIRLRRPADWLRVIGPGAIIASLTIGTGELIFSARSGVIFGYSILWVFTLILLIKWAMVFAISRHFVLSGVHPIARWVSLPGPRGWLPMTMFLLGSLLFPVWVGFHSGVIGTLLSDITGLNAHVSALIALGGVMLLVYGGGYRLLERIQIAIVTIMVAAVLISLAVLRPDWFELAVSLVWPTSLAYPEWLTQSDEYASIAARPVWVEVGTYVGVIGGSSYDYLAYSAYLREKNWGRASSADEPKPWAGSSHELTDAVWLPAIDLIFSFAAVLIISAAFVASGQLVLGPAHRIPNDNNMLNLQAEFLTRLHPWLYPLYVAGALLTMLGTLYGTIEVAPAVFGEWRRAYFRHVGASTRFPTVTWCAAGGLAVLLGRWLMELRSTASGVPAVTLVDIVTPAAIVTGVFTCGIISWSGIWMDRRFLPRPLRMNPALAMLNVIGGLVFFGVALRSLYDFKSLGFSAWLILLSFFLLGSLVAWCMPAQASSPTSESTTSH